MKIRLAVLTTVLVLGCRTGAPVADSSADHPEQSRFGTLQFVGAIAPSSALENAKIGGLSGIVWDGQRSLLLAISDDPGTHGDPRFIEFELQLPSDQQAGSWTASRAVTLSTSDGESFVHDTIDAESIDLFGEGLVITSEGGKQGQPFVRTFDLEGNQIEVVSMPSYMLYGEDVGARPNMAIESVSALPNGTLFAGFENALVQDGPAASVDQPSPARILRWQGKGAAEFVYPTDPVVDAPLQEGGFHTNGLVELLALDDQHLLALERSYTAGFLVHVRLYSVDLSQATDVSATSSIGDSYQPAAKTLLADLDDLGFNVDNLEGLAWGPTMADGRKSLLMVSDDNFSPLQRTHLLVFAVGEKTPTISQIQSAGHRSPFEDQWLFDVAGTVTQAVEIAERPGLAWIQTSGDQDLNTSDGLRIRYDWSDVSLRPGDSIVVSGQLREEGREGELSVTTLTANTVMVTGTDDIPAAVSLDPQVELASAATRPFGDLPLDDDAMNTFSPEQSSVDLLESLEGMRVTISESTSVSGTSRFGEIVLSPGGANGVRSQAGGVVLTPESFNSQRLVAVSVGATQSPTVKVGDYFERPITGVLDYSFANFRLRVEDWPTPTLRVLSEPQPLWDIYDDDFTFATYNVLNLDPEDGEQFDQVAISIVDQLLSPDVLALQEIQDDNGANDEGVTSANLTLTMLIEAIQIAGGPDYAYAQIDPLHNAEGGQPFGNIRNVYLYQPDRVQLIKDGHADSDTSIMVAPDGGFDPSPGRVAVEDPGFAGDLNRGWEANRPCLAAEFLVSGDRWQFINCHLKSKRGDDRLFGSNQPPVFHTEGQRSAQTQSLASVAEEVLLANPEARLVVLGDTNEHDFRAPIAELTSVGLENLVERIPQAERYSYNFNGNSQLLDNVLVSPAVVECSPEVAIAHINVDFPDAGRASDHDPIAVRVPSCD